MTTEKVVNPKSKKFRRLPAPCEGLMVLSGNGDASGLKLSGLGKEAPLPFWWIQGKASALKLLDVANNAKRYMPARGPLNMNMKSKKKGKVGIKCLSVFMERPIHF